MAQVQLLIRANYPLWELMMPLRLSRAEDKQWQRTLRNVALPFGVEGNFGSIFHHPTASVGPRYSRDVVGDVFSEVPAGLLEPRTN